MMFHKLLLSASIATLGSYASAASFVMEKYGTGYSIDGNGGAQVGQQLYLWDTNLNNVNQQWVQLSRGNGYYSYKKEDTNLCWDAGSSGSRQQAVTLQECNEGNYNQHFSKVKIYEGTEIYRFEKRNATGFSLDGGGGAENRQSIYLWNSSDSNINQQWELHRIDDGNRDDGGGSNGFNKLTVDTAFDDGSSHNSYPAGNAIDGDSGWASRWAASGSPVNLTLELNEVSKITELGIAWGRGNERAYTFEVYARPTTSGANSWTKIYDGVSSGSESGFEVVDVTDIDAKQVRIKTFENTSGSSWTNITEVEVYGGESDGSGGGDDDNTGGGDDDVPPGSAEVPSDLMDNCNQWKITYPDGVEDKTLCGEENNEYFYVNNSGNAMVFFAPVRDGNGTTPNSSYIRSELREREADGSKDIYWSTSGEHVVYVNQAITHLPIVKSHLVATQIHGNKDEGIDDALVLRLEDSHLFLSFNGGKLRSDVTVTNNYSLGTNHEVIFEVIDGKHYVYYSEDGNLESAYNAGNADQYLVRDGSNDYVMDRSYGDAYFKIGNYTQSNADREGSATGDPDNYGEVVVYDFWVDHQ
ncbi:polysaccharide lyase family 7 protein [Gilvimarinus xylanilyticus]|uniref:Polysaccharide lyase family 7 protein n=1 Tax=Gilvimarinus xylanilyticus TaxID=2944139 RepID=A0A9X2I038_9GAMM|nr:polysaccharide lyase family 7 protein [Gilvimarinus xylanilyticus]MCP8899701.1 polysaccharide lyase family 7 protein [Gilvimarinus xylanilyticus]